MFNVIVERNGKFKPYNVIPYLISRYESTKEKTRPVTFEGFKDFIIQESKYQWWSRCEYEIILSDWPCQRTEEKWDVYRQVMMNINVITEILMANINKQ